MALEGPLRDLGIHDVFQLLDLGRKSGVLTVGSELRNNAGHVWFADGCVIYASIRSNLHPLGALLLTAGKIAEGDLALARAMQAERGERRRLGEILVDIGAVSARELEAQVRRQVEAVIFELLSWDEGYFRFEEESPELPSAEATVRIPIEALLMEGARRIDEWSRIRERIPHLDVVPRLAAPDAGAMPQLDLLPSEWRFLTLIDGRRSLRELAAALRESEFDVARIAFGLVSTGVLELLGGSADERLPTASGPVAIAHARRARGALLRGDVEEAIAEARLALVAEPQASDARRTLLAALRRAGRREQWANEVRLAAAQPAQHPETWLEAAYLAALEGQLEDAVRGWQLYLAAGHEGPDAERAQAALAAATRLRELVDGHFHA